MSKSSKKTIFFVAPISGRDKYGKYYDKITSFFKKKGFDIIDASDDFTLTDLNSFTKDDLRNYYVSYQNTIKEADYFVSESSVSSASVGYEIRFAVANNKPTLVLRREDEAQPGPPLSGNPSKLLSYAEYNDKNLEKKLESFLKKAEKGIFVKRLPIEFTHNQVEYVTYRQFSAGVKRSFNAIVREIIEEARAKDKKYKETMDNLV